MQRGASTDTSSDSQPALYPNSHGRLLHMVPGGNPGNDIGNVEDGDTAVLDLITVESSQEAPTPADIKAIVQRPPRPNSANTDFV